VAHTHTRPDVRYPWLAGAGGGTTQQQEQRAGYPFVVMQESFRGGSRNKGYHGMNDIHGFAELRTDRLELAVFEFTLL
jgi:hypothetical protein